MGHAAGARSRARRTATGVRSSAAVRVRTGSGDALGGHRDGNTGTRDDASNPLMPSLYVPPEDRYQRMEYRRCGRSGLQLPPISLGLWQNFGDDFPLDNSRAILRRAFDLGITHFDLANNYGPPYGSAEKNFGRVFDEDFRRCRDELVISTKAGWDMWPGPYGEFGSRKYLLASLDAVAAADAARLRRHLLLAPVRPGHAARGDGRRARRRRPVRARRGTSGSRRTGPSGPRRRRGYSREQGIHAADPPAVVLDAQPLDRGASCSTWPSARASA